jgi:hypothetical protein
LNRLGFEVIGRENLGEVTQLVTLLAHYISAGKFFQDVRQGFLLSKGLG